MSGGYLLMYGVVFGPEAKNRDLVLAFLPRLQALVIDGKLEPDQISQALSEVKDGEPEVVFTKMQALVDVPSNPSYKTGWTAGRRDLTLSLTEKLKLLQESGKLSDETRKEILHFALYVFDKPLG